MSSRPPTRPAPPPGAGSETVSLAAPTGHVGLADMLSAYLEHGDAGLAGLARMLELPKAPEPRTTRVEKGPSRSPSPSAFLPTKSEPPPEPSEADEEKLRASGPWLTFHRPVRVRHRQDSSGQKGVGSRSGEPSQGSRPPATPYTLEELRSLHWPTPEARPIVAWPRLFRRLDAEMAAIQESRAVDVDKLVEGIARGRPFAELPHKASLAPARVVLILDNSDRLRPFFDDFLALARKLQDRFGEARVRRISRPRPGRSLPTLDLGDDEMLLAVTDLGFFGEPRDRRPWERLGRRLEHRRSRFLALCPAPAWRWEAALAERWSAVDWSRPEGAGARQRPVETHGLRPAELLLTLLAPATRLEPGLVREVRTLLGARTDLGTEIEAWNHPTVDGSSASSLRMDPDERQRRLASWNPARFVERTGLDVATLESVARAIVHWHRAYPEHVWAADVAALHACGLGDQVLGRQRVEQAIQVFERSAATLRPAVDSSEVRGSTTLLTSLVAWVGREAERIPPHLDQIPAWSSAWNEIIRLARRHRPGMGLPAGATPDMLDPPETHPIRSWVVRQRAAGLILSPQEARGAWGPPVATLRTQDSRIFVGLGSQEPIEVALPLERSAEEAVVAIPTPHAEQRLSLITDQESIELETWQRPEWASAAGRDGYGLWAAFEVEGLEQRMRWIPPGRFWMGSPESEEGRDSDEGPQHEVTLTEGYWLAETPCIQALWEAVMGDNPSHFQSPERPVEQVSWDDVQIFLDRLSFRYRDLEVVLPTEAEWEYACRAGTETATWAGDLMIRGQRDAPVLDEISWYAGNSGVGYELERGVDSSAWPEKQHAHEKAGTRKVGEKAANPWGLRDMLGNVDEWCWDRGSAYTEAPAINSEGPSEGAGRVFRGGSWHGPAQFVRAAFRDWVRPEDRDRNLGFRLSRGPRAGGAQVGEREITASGAARRGTSRRARSRRSRAWVDRLSWAVDGGLDEYGRWAALEVGEVRHRLRWMYPGRFWMGSPEEEQGRYGDEGLRHEVMLTEGFWLGEVPCTQALWAEVMGSNPSSFQSPARPVEGVSWEDCQGFFRRLEERVPGFGGRLPTEAQWEYACRAGTETATWAGDLEILGRNNAPILDVLAWYGGNSGVGFDLENGDDSSAWEEKQYAHRRAGTRAVGQKARNPWGLYDMLGNVWEWCSDSSSAGKGYPGGDRVNPEGAEGAWRVFRGGSWGAPAQSVRAAYRGWSHPGLRGGSLGFRISRGPVELRSAERGESVRRSGARRPRDEGTGAAPGDETDVGSGMGKGDAD